MDLGSMLGSMLGGQNISNQQGYNQQNQYQQQDYNGYNSQYENNQMRTMNQCTGTFKTHNELLQKKDQWLHMKEI